MSGPSSELFIVGGFDEYSGNVRNVTASIERGNYIKVTCEGTDANAASLITPDQARHLGLAMIALADSVTGFWQNIQPRSQ